MIRSEYQANEYLNCKQETKQNSCYNFGEIKFKPPVPASQFWVILVATLRTIKTYFTH